MCFFFELSSDTWNVICRYLSVYYLNTISLGTVRTLNVHKTFRRHPGRLTNALTYPLINFPAPYIPISRKWIYIKEESFHLKNDSISKKWIYIKEESVHSKLKIFLLYFPSELNFKMKVARSKIDGTNKYPCKTYSAVVFVCFRHTHLP